MVETDVVVLGSGASGLAAALTAAVGGATVTVLEASSLYGGTSAISGGGMWLPCNTLDPDWTDSREDAKAYLTRLAPIPIPEAVIDRYLDEAGKVPDFFAQHSPLSFEADIGRPDYHAPWAPGSSLTSRTVFATPYEMPRLGALDAQVRRPGVGGIDPVLHSEEREAGEPGSPERAEKLDKLIEERVKRGVVARGLALVGGLMEGCVDAGVTFVNATRGKSLIVENGRVVGVRAEHDGNDIEYRARLGVILASGGFEWNRDLWDNLVSRPLEMPTTPPVENGDGLIMAAAVGAKLANLDKVTWCTSRYLGEVYDGHPYTRSQRSAEYPGEILVNRTGRRFVNETLDYNDIGYVYTHFDPDHYEFDNYPRYLIGDAESLKRVEEMNAGFTNTDGDGWFVSDTLRELAAQLDIDPDGLEAQVKEWNADAVTGVDPVFHRGEEAWGLHSLPNHVSVGPLGDGPYVGYQLRAGVFGTRGGPVINENAQIVSFANVAIPGLYGAGNVVAHPFRVAYPGGGGTLGPCVTFGHIAGKSILADNGR